MPNSTQELSVDDLSHAVGYLFDRVRLQAQSYQERGDAREIDSEFYALTSARRSQQKAADLTLWCSKNLTRTEWNRLRVAIRKRRERWSKFNDQKTIVVTAKVHRLLSTIALRDNVTFCDVLEALLVKAAKSTIRFKAKSRE